MSEARSMGDLEKAACLLQKANAEIERLNLVINVLEAAAKRDTKLITELADALVSQDRPDTHPYLREDHELIQRAREATKDE